MYQAEIMLISSSTFGLSRGMVRLPFTSTRMPVRTLMVHVAYWLLVTGFFIFEKKYLIHKASLPYFVLCVSVRIALLMLIAYLHLQYFLPRYLLRQRYVSYVFSLLAAVLGYMVIQSLFDYYLYGYVIGPMRTSDIWEALSYNFFSTLWYLALMLSLKLSIDWYHQKIKVQQMTVENLHAELGLLRAQVNPHFLFNVLNNLYALTLRGSPMAPEVVLKLSGMMEYMLYESMQARVSLVRELEYLHNFIDLERLRFADDVQISIKLTGDPGSLQIAPLLILPLVENAFKHGPGKSSANRWIKLTVAIEGSQLTVAVANNFSGNRSAPSDGGIGQVNLKRRLELLYPGESEFIVDQDRESYTATLMLNLCP